MPTVGRSAGRKPLRGGVQVGGIAWGKQRLGMGQVAGAASAISRRHLYLVPALTDDQWVADDRRVSNALEKLTVAVVEALAELPASSPLRRPLLRLLRALQ